MVQVRVEKNLETMKPPIIFLFTLSLTLNAPADLTFQQVAAGTSHTVAIKTNGTLWAWGWNYRGQLGDGTTVNTSSPHRTRFRTNQCTHR
jgi:alpha-tubulin suppressor-like RCC1 family protein